MTAYEKVQAELRAAPKTWLVTGVAGLEKLLHLNQWVVGLDNYSTGHKSNLEQVARSVKP